MKMKKNGYEYKIHSRYGEYAVCVGVNKRFPEGLDTIEVWKIQKANSDHTFPSGKVVKAGTEKAPGNEDWGINAWTYSTIDEAIDFALSGAEMMHERRKAELV